MSVASDTSGIDLRLLAWELRHAIFSVVIVTLVHLGYLPVDLGIKAALLYIALMLIQIVRGDL